MSIEEISARTQDQYQPIFADTDPRIMNAIHCANLSLSAVFFMYIDDAYVDESMNEWLGQHYKHVLKEPESEVISVEHMLIPDSPEGIIKIFANTEPRPGKMTEAGLLALGSIAVPAV